MRLTLRTLLAYLDDRLSPTNAKEIGQKITNSPFATDLMERIRDVKRRRRLAAPEKTPSIIDANLIAEYLDDQLTPELVARVEREILASDAMLAEVASAHEILGLLRDPVTVEPRLRERLYGLDPTGKLEVVRAISGEPIPGQATNGPVPQWKPLKPQTVASRRLPGIIVSVLALIWLAVLASDSDLFNRQPVASPDESKKAAADAADIVPPAEAKQVADADQAAPPEPETKPGNLVAATGESGAVKGAEALPKAETEPALQKQPDTALVVPAEPAVASDEAMQEVKPDTTTANATAAAPAESEVVPALTAEAEQPIAYFLQGDARSILLLNEEKQRWFDLSEIPGGESIDPELNNVNCRPIIDTSWFGVTETFPLQIATNSRGYSATVLGPCLVRFQPGSLGGLDVLTGRMKLSTDRNVAWDEENRPLFVLGTVEKKSQLALQTQQTRIAIEVLPVAAMPSVPGDDPVAAARVTGLPYDSDLRVSVVVLEGSVGLRMPDQDEEVLLSKGQRAMWTMLEMRDVSMFTVDNGQPLPSAPAWLFDSEQELVPETTRQNDRLLEALAEPGEPGDCVLPLLDDRNPQIGVLAVHVLSLTRDTDRLLSILFEPRDETVHRAAIDGLSFIANSSISAGQAIRNSLETRVPKAEADLMMPLILGLTDAQIADPSVAADLMEMLANDRLATRTLAIYRMEQVTKDRRGFHPDGESSRRRDAIRRWQRYLEHNSGRLLP